MKQWNVCLNRKSIDIITTGDNMTVEEVRDSLINHDGLDPSITVRLIPRPRAFYIQRKGQGCLETVDEFSTRKEARAMLKEYRMSDHTAEHYLSTRACGDWSK